MCVNKAAVVESVRCQRSSLEHYRKSQKGVEQVGTKKLCEMVTNSETWSQAPALKAFRYRIFTIIFVYNSAWNVKSGSSDVFYLDK